MPLNGGLTVSTYSIRYKQTIGEYIYQIYLSMGTRLNTYSLSFLVDDRAWLTAEARGKLDYKTLVKLVEFLSRRQALP